MVQALTLTYVLVQLVTLYFCKSNLQNRVRLRPYFLLAWNTNRIIFTLFPVSGIRVYDAISTQSLAPPPHHMLSTAEILIQPRIDKPTSSQDLLHKTIQGKNAMLFCCPVIWVHHCCYRGYTRICSCSIERRKSKREGKRGDIVRLGEEGGMGPI